MGSRSKLLMTAGLLTAVMAFSSCGAKKSVGTDDSVGGSSGRGASDVGGAQAEPGEMGDENPMDPSVPTPRASTDESVGPVVNVPPIKGDEITPEEIRNFDEASEKKRLTGAANREGLLYTASGIDDVGLYFKRRNEQVNAAQRANNINFAGSVANADVVRYDGEAVVRVQLIEGNNVASYEFATELTSGMMQARQVVREGLTGRATLTAGVKCLDLDGGCENILLRMTKQISGGGTAITNVIIRDSIADLYFELAPLIDQSNNPEFLRWKQYLVNSKYQQMALERIDNIILKSFEVVNGRSGVQIELRTLDNQFVGLNGPLLAPEVGTRVNIPFSLMRAEEIDSADLTMPAGAGYTLANSIAQARLVNNNGLGQIRIQLQLRKVSNFKQDKINLVLLRRMKPLVPANDDLVR